MSTNENTKADNKKLQVVDRNNSKTDGKTAPAEHIHQSEQYVEERKKMIANM